MVKQVYLELGGVGGDGTENNQEKNCWGIQRIKGFQERKFQDVAKKTHKLRFEKCPLTAKVWVE